MKNEKVENLLEELEELNWQERDLVNMQRKCPYDSPTYKSLNKDIIAIEKLEEKLKKKIYKLNTKPIKKKCKRPASQSELIKKHNKDVRKTKRKMLKVKL